jgi:uncharacterized protein (DUF1501 family)
MTNLTSPAVATGTSATACGCPDFTLSRRRLLATAAAGAGTLAGASLIGDAFRQVAYGATTGGNVVVVLSLRGGSDGLSIVVPRSTADQLVLETLRPDLTIDPLSLPFGDANFGFHPALAPLQSMWNAGTFGAVHGVGLPMSNRSHFDAMIEMEDADPGSTARVGWINRMIGTTALPEEHLALGTSMIPLQLAGPRPSLAVGSVNELVLPSLWADQRLGAAVTKAWKGTGTLNKSVQQAVATTQRLRSLAGTDMDAAAAPYPEGSLKRVLANTAALIKADVGARVVTIDYGNWDMHEGQGRPTPGDWMYDQLAHLANSLVAFFADLGSDANRVTLITLSEFGRRVEQNGSGGNAGTDHGYGNAMLMFGAGVNGGQVNGAWRGLDSLNSGDVSLAQDYRSVVWEVMKHRFPEISSKRSTIFPGFSPETVGSML